MFQQLLHEDAIHVGFKAETKENAFSQLLELLPGWKLNKKQKQIFLNLLLMREIQGTTAIGDGLALPHAFSQEITEPLAVLGVSRDGVDFSALDGAPVHLILLTLFPENEEAKVQKREILQKAQFILSDTFMMSRMKNAGSAEEVYEILGYEARLAATGS